MAGQPELRWGAGKNGRGIKLDRRGKGKRGRKKERKKRKAAADSEEAKKTRDGMQMDRVGVGRGFVFRAGFWTHRSFLAFPLCLPRQDYY